MRLHFTVPASWLTYQVRNILLLLPLFCAEHSSSFISVLYCSTIPILFYYLCCIILVCSAVLCFVVYFIFHYALLLSTVLFSTLLSVFLFLHDSDYTFLNTALQKEIHTKRKYFILKNVTFLIIHFHREYSCKPSLDESVITIMRVLQ